MISEEQLRKLIDLRNKKISAQEEYKNYLNEMSELVTPHVKEDGDPMQFEIDDKEYEFIYSAYYQCIIFRPKMRKGGNCYGTATRNKSNFRRPVYKKRGENKIER